MAISQQQLPGNPYFVGGTDVGIADGGTGVSSLPTGILVGAGAGAITSLTQSESTFAPNVTLVGGAGNTVPVYTTNVGRHTRIGRQVFVEVYLNGDGGAEGAGTGTFNIALPVTASANNQPGQVLVGTALNGSVSYLLTGEILAAATTVALSTFNLIASEILFTGADQNNVTRTVRLSFQYEV